MKKFKKQLSLLLAAALVVSSLAIGFGTLQVSAVTQATGQLATYHFQVKTAGQDCNGTGTANSLTVTIFYSDGTSAAANTIAGESSPNYFENGNTDGITLSPQLPAKPISRINFISSGGDRWKVDWVNFYYSPDSGGTWWKIGTHGGFDESNTNRNFTYPSDYSLNTSSLNKTLTFNAGGGTVNGGQSSYQIYSEHGATLPSSNLPTVDARPGYTFNGWNPALPSSGPSGDTTYTASWTQHIYYIAFSGNGSTGGSVSTMTCAYTTTYPLNANNFTRTGYSFTGWNTAANGGGTAYGNGVNVSQLTPTNGATVTLYAQWAPITYNIAFNGNGNSGGSTVTPQIFTYNVAQPLNANGFTRTGYSFAGWSTTAGGPLEYNDSQSVNNLANTQGATVTLYARWTPYSYTITYDVNAVSGWGQTGPMDPTSHQYDVPQALRSNLFYRTGYTFIGWATSAGGGVQYANGESVTNLTNINGATVTLYAVWQPNQYSVRYNGNGATGGATADSYHTYDTPKNLTANGFTKTGHTFAGWAISAEGAVAYANGASVSNLTPAVNGIFDLYAKWTPITYTITYNGNGSTGGSTANSVHTYDVAKNLTNNGYTKLGHTFQGWALSAGATTPVWTNGQSVTNISSTNGATVTFFAVWQANSYYISFDANGGTGGTEPTLMVYNTTLVVPNVAKTGYTLSGWVPALPSPLKVPAAHTTYTAQWTVTAFLITFDDNGGEGGTSELVDYGVTPTPPNVTKVGHTFAGWSPSPIVPVTEATTYTAQWTVNNYNLTFNANEGTGGTGPTPTPYGSAVTPPTVTRTGYTFNGWDTTVISPMPAEAKVYYAQWLKNNYSITFDADGGTGGGTTSMPYGDPLTPPTVTKTGYTFAGWSPTVPATVPAANTTYVAQWTVNTYLITFDAAGGTGGTSASLDYNSTLTPPTVTKTGYTFASWSPAVPATVPAANTTYTAQWTVNQYTVTFDSNGGSTVTPVTTDYGAPVTKPADPVKTGYNFINWYYDAGLSTLVNWPYPMGAANTTFYAKWTAKEYAISYDGNGAAGGSTATSTHTYDLASTLTPNGFTRTGYAFTGWALSSGGAKVYDDAQPVTNVTTGSDITFFAVWALQQYDINFDANGGTGANYTITQPYLSSVTLPGTGYTKTGYTFRGWSENAGATTWLSSFTVPVGGATLYAIYTINTYTLSFNPNGGGGTIAPVTQNFNTTTTLPSAGFTRGGYTLLRWNTQADGLGTNYAKGATFTFPGNDQTLYAVWEFSAANYSAVIAAVDLAGATTLPANAANDPGYMVGGQIYVDWEFTNGGYYPRAQFSSASLAAMTGAINAVNWGLNSSQQAIVDGYAAAITAAYNNIALSLADYTQLDALIAQAQGLNRLLYTEASLAPVDEALGYAVDAKAENYKVPLQELVNEIANMLSNALLGLVFLPADYSEVNAEWNSRPANLYTDYTTESVAALVDYYEQEIIWDLTIDQQATVDFYAAELRRLKSELVLKPGDYTPVYNAIRAIPDPLVNDAGNPPPPVNWEYMYNTYTNSTVTNLYNAVTAVVYEKPVTEQPTINGYASAILAATSLLEPLDADYTYLGIALENEPPYPESYYTPVSWTAYSDSIVAGHILYDNQNLNITQQYLINNATAAINAAYAALVLKAVTYTVKYQTTSGTTLAADLVVNATAGDEVTENAAAVTGYTPTQATQQMILTGTSSLNIIIFTYTINSYTVTFVSNGGTAVDPITQNYGTLVEQPANPDKTGYTFSAWYSDAGLTNAVTWPYPLGASNVTFYAKWTANNYTVSFDVQGGLTTPDSISVTYDSVYGTLPVPEKEGYTFDGWYTGANGTGTTVVSTTTVSITEAQTLYAKWAVNSYTVTFDANGGTGGTSSQMAYGSAITPPVVSKIGYTFASWSPAVPGTVPVGGGTYTAQWTVNQYTISFDANGGTGTAADVTQDYTTEVTLPTEGFTKTGYTFAGWSATPEGTTPLLSYYVPANNATLYAIYTVNQYTVSFDANGGIGSAADVTQDFGTEVTLPTEGFAKTGYTFIGWSETPEGTIPLTGYLVPADDATLYAVYEVNEYTVSFSANGGTGTAADVTQDYGTEVTLPTEGFTKTGYTFAGWSTTPGGTTPLTSYYVPANNATLYAVYAVNQYTVSFDANGGTGTVADITQDYDTGVLLPTEGVTKTGYSLIGWGTTPEETTPITSYIVPAYNTTLYAIYEINQYTVSFDANDGTGTAADVTQDYGTAVTLPTEGFAKLGHTFIGWNTTPGAGTALASYEVPANNATLYAIYTVNSYTVTFDANGGTGSAAPVTQAYNTAVTLPTDGFAKTGYSFIGWNTDPYAIGPISEYIMPLNGGTLYAIYTINQYTVSFNANGGTGTAADVTQDYGTAVTLPTEGFTKLGYTFIGWSTDPGATTPLTSYNVPAGNATLYAVYAVNQYTVYYDANGGTGTADPATQNYGSSVALPGSGFTKDGYSFIGWNTDPEATEVLTNYTVPAADSTLYAIYAVNSYTVTFDANEGTGSAAPVTQAYNTAVTLPTTGFAKLGHTFIGWNTTSGAATALSSYTMPAGDTTLYAVYTVNSYTITFDANEGLGGTEQLMVYGTVLSAPTVTKDGYTFAGWLPVLPETVPAQNTTYVAQWSTNSYTVSFDSAGGTPVASITQAYNTPITEPTAPTREGYNFGGWTPAVPSFMPSSNTQCVAQWNPKSYLITFDANGGTGGTTGNLLEYNTPLTAPAVTNPGYTLTGWSPALPATVPAADTVYVAQWSIGQFTVSFNSAGGSPVNSITQNYGTAITPPAEPAREGYTFSGWVPTIPLVMPAEDIECVAQWTINQYTVSFNSAGGSAVESIIQEFGTAITAPENPTKTGFTFAGWTPPVPLVMPASNTQCVAQWTVNSYTITWDANGGTGGGSNSCEYGAMPTPIDPGTLEGYTFSGWSPAVVEATGDTTYTAQWTINAPPELIPLEGSSTVIDNENFFIYGLEQYITQEAFEAAFVQVLGNGRLVITPTPNGFGTGTKIELISNATEEVVRTWYIVIFGDVNGDGYAGAVDADLINNHENYLVEWNETETYLFRAGDVNGDQYAGAVDADIVNNCENYLLWLDQKTGLAFEYEP